MDNIKQKLNSRKFWAAFIGALAPVVLSFVGQDIAIGEALQLSAGIVISYILGQGWVDAASAKLSSDG